MEFPQYATVERHGGYFMGDYQEPHHYNSYQQNYPDYQQQQHHQQHMNDEPIGSHDGGNGAFNSNFRKRRWNNFAKDAHTDSANHAKLYVQPIPRAANEEDICPVFEKYGRVFEVILPRDKRTGQRLGGYCFVKYATPEEADFAIKALDNQYTFDGEMGPIRVKYADNERGHAGKPLNRAPVSGPYTGDTSIRVNCADGEWGHASKPLTRAPAPGLYTSEAPIRVNCADGEWGHAIKPLIRAPVPVPCTGEAPIRVNCADGESIHASKSLNRAPIPGLYTGASVNKLYIGGLSRQTSKHEIQELFSPYGFVEDIHIALDEMKQSRGFGFIKFSHRDMALAAIRALNGNFTMRGCDQPLVVRFADPKKPRTGESRGNYAFSSPNVTSCSHESINRLGSNVGDSMGGHCLPNTSHSVANSSNLHLQSQSVSSVGSQKMADPSAAQPPLQSPSQWNPKASQPMEAPSCQSAQQSVSEIQKQSDPMQTSTQNLKQQQNIQIAAQEKVCNPQTAATVTSTTIGMPTNQLKSTDLSECDWSEHTCPDGYKYYYNCMTRESKWEKPREFILFEQQLEKQQKLQNRSQQLHSPLPHISSQELVETQKLKVPMVS